MVPAKGLYLWIDYYQRAHKIYMDLVLSQMIADTGGCRYKVWIVLLHSPIAMSQGRPKSRFTEIMSRKLSLPLRWKYFDLGNNMSKRRN